MGWIKDKMTQDMQLRNYRESTIQCYLLYIKKMAKHFKQWPDQLSEDDLRQYILHVKENTKAGSASYKVLVASLKFLYTHTLNTPDKVFNIPWPKVPRPLPVILNPEEIEQLLSAIEEIKYRMMVMLAYGTGLRVNEVCRLTPADIDSKRMLIHVRDGKNRRDRYVMLSDRMLNYLRLYWKQERPEGEWLFPGKDPDQSISDCSLRKVLSNAAKTAGIFKKARIP